VQGIARRHLAAITIYAYVGAIQALGLWATEVT